MNKNLKIIIFSMDLIFIEIIKRILSKQSKNYSINVYSLFSEAKSISHNDSINLMIIDDQIIGASNSELISSLRLKQKIVCPLICFGVEDYNGERKAILSGATSFSRKPFNPNEKGEIMKKLLLT